MPCRFNCFQCESIPCILCTKCNAADPTPALPLANPFSHKYKRTARMSTGASLKGFGKSLRGKPYVKAAGFNCSYCGLKYQQATGTGMCPSCMAIPKHDQSSDSETEEEIEVTLVCNNCLKPCDNYPKHDVYHGKCQTCVDHFDSFFSWGRKDKHQV